MQRDLAQQHWHLHPGPRGRRAERVNSMLQRGDLQRERDDLVRAERVSGGEHDEAGEQSRERLRAGDLAAQPGELFEHEPAVVCRYLACRRRHRAVSVCPAAAERELHV